MAFSMTDDELKTRIRNGTPIKILAELNGVSDQSIYNWMKKNGIQRPGKDEKKTEDKVTNLKVLEKIQGEISLLEGTIKSLEDALEEHRTELEIWKELEGRVK